MKSQNAVERNVNTRTEGNVKMPVNVNSYTQRILANISVNLALVQSNIASPDTP